MRKVLIIGNGGRESAIGMKLLESENTEVFMWKATGVLDGIEPYKNDLDGLNELLETVDTSFDLVVIGPEQPLVSGGADLLRGKGISVFGPGREGSKLEGSKAFSKIFMDKHGLPTAQYKTVRSVEEGVQVLLKDFQMPVYIKASGLAGGKGAVFCNDREKGNEILRDIFE